MKKKPLPGLDHAARYKARTYAKLIRREGHVDGLAFVARMRPFIDLRSRLHDAAEAIQSGRRTRCLTDKTEALGALEVLDAWVLLAYRHADAEHLDFGHDLVAEFRAWASREEKRPAKWIAGHVLRIAAGVEKLAGGER
jgi:hypothetical protein